MPYKLAEDKNANSRDWVARNPEKRRAISKKSYDANQETRRSYYLLNRDRLLATHRAYEKRKRAEARATGTVWRKGRDIPGQRDANLRQKYGIGLAEYQTMYQAQDGKCLICTLPHVLLVVDHGHETGRVRGLLCPACNISIGHLERMTRLGAEKFSNYLKTKG